MRNIEVDIECIIRDYCEPLIWKKLEEKGIDPELVCFTLHYDSEEYDIEGEMDF